MKETKSKKWLLFSIPAAVALVYDILIKCGLSLPTVIVDENYIYYIFSLIFTVATLCCTLLSIIVGVGNYKVLGLKIKEIVSLKASPINLAHVIVFSILIILLSIPALFFNLMSFMTTLALTLLIMLMFNTITLFKIVFDYNYSSEIIMKSVVEYNCFKPSYVLKWIDSLNKSIKENDADSENTFLDMLFKASKDNSEILNLIEKHIINSFELSCEYQSLATSFVKVLRLNEKDSPLFNEVPIMYNYINSLKYSSPSKINRVNLAGTIDEIIMCNIIPNDDKKRYCLWLIKAVIENESIAETNKLKLLYDAFRKMSELSDRFGEGQVRSETIICVFRNEILLSNNYEFAKEIYSELLKALYINNVYSNEKCFASTIAQLVRLVYFWGYLEKESISEEKRNEISELLICCANTNDNADLTMKSIIDRNSANIIDYLISDSFVQPFNLDYLDYSPDILGAKTVVATNRNKIKFAFWMYTLFGYNYSVFPINKYLSAYCKNKQLLYRDLCTSITEELNPDNTLTDYAKDNIEKLKKILGKRSSIPFQYLIESYDAVNSIIKEMNDINEDDPIDNTGNIIKKLLGKMIDKKPEINFDRAILLNDSTTFQLPILICRRSNKYESFIAHEVHRYLIQIVNQIISQRLRRVDLSFDIRGVETLLAELKQGNYLIRNYTFYDDLGISADVRRSAIYNQLKKVVDDIHMMKNTNIHKYLFLTEADIKFNYEIVEMSVLPLTSEMTTDFLNQHKISEGQYKIDDGIYTTQQAIEYVNKNRCFVSVTAKVETNINDSSGFQVNFVY